MPLFFSGFAGAQINSAFIEHLSSNKLQDEHRAYLNSVKGPADSLHYFEAKYHLDYFSDSLFLKHFYKSSALCSGDSQLVKKAGEYFLLGNNKTTRDNWFKQLEAQRAEKFDARLVYNVSLDPNNYSVDIFPAGIQKQFLSYKKAYNKKPLVGAALSTVIPGLGKVYAGKTASGLAAFLANAGYAVQTLESGAKLGPKHPFTIINATLFAVFYLSNIYGGYHSIIDLRKERKKQFVKDAVFYCN